MPNPNRPEPWLMWLRRAVVPVLLRAAKPLVWLRRRLRPHKVTVGKIEPAPGQEGGLTILCGLTDQIRHYFLNLAYDGKPVESEARPVRLMDVFRRDWARKKESSLIVVDANQMHFDWLKEAGWFFIPIWISGEVSLPIPEEFMKRETVRSDLRKIQRHQFEYEVTHDDARFKDYYQNMHLPFITQAHGDETCYDSYAEKRREKSEYDLLLVHKQTEPGRDLAGMFIVYEPAAPRLWSLGVRNDGIDHVKEGIPAALYHYTFKHLSERGFDRVNLGSCRAFFHNGVLNFKRKMSQRLKNAHWDGVALKITSLTPGVKSFLLKNPFIFKADGKLYGAIFAEEKLTLEKIQKIDKDYFHPGLSALVIHSFCADEDFKLSSLPPLLAERIKIRPATEVVG
jgi:hypothetical protein